MSSEIRLSNEMENLHQLSSFNDEENLHQLYAFGEEENLQQLSRWKNSVKFRNGDTIKCCEVIHISSVYSRFMINNRYNY